MLTQTTQSAADTTFPTGTTTMFNNIQQTVTITSFGQKVTLWFTTNVVNDGSGTNFAIQFYVDGVASPGYPALQQAIDAVDSEIFGMHAELVGLSPGSYTVDVRGTAASAPLTVTAGRAVLTSMTTPA